MHIPYCFPEVLLSQKQVLAFTLPLVSLEEEIQASPSPPLTRNTRLTFPAVYRDYSYRRGRGGEKSVPEIDNSPDFSEPATSLEKQFLSQSGARKCFTVVVTGYEGG